MLFARRAGALLLGAAMAVLPVVSHSAPEVGAYRWDAPAGPANIDEFSNWLGSAVTIASLFHGRNTWSEIEGQDSQLSAWSQWVRAQQGRNLTIAVGMFPPGGSLASVFISAPLPEPTRRRLVMDWMPATLPPIP